MSISFFSSSKIHKVGCTETNILGLQPMSLKIRTKLISTTQFKRYIVEGTSSISADGKSVVIIVSNFPPKVPQISVTTDHINVVKRFFRRRNLSNRSISRQQLGMESTCSTLFSNFISRYLSSSQIYDPQVNSKPCKI